VTRRGAEVVSEGNTASAEWRRAVDRARQDVEERRTPLERDDTEADEVWVRDPEPVVAPRAARTTAAGGRPAPSDAGPAASSSGTRRSRRLPEEVTEELVEAGGARRGVRLAKDLAAAAAAYEAGRYLDAQKMLRPLVEAAPTAAGARELYGLTLYRLGRWRAALSELAAYHQLTGSVDQYPVVADCERALRHHDAVDQLWEGLRRASPGAAVLTEGRLVVAGSLADRGRLPDAIELLGRHAPDRARPNEGHLRTWYALADLYERAGDIPRARQLFTRIVSREPDFFDAAERLASLR